MTTPDAVVIFSGGCMPREGGGSRATTYDEKDGFGTLGGEDRVRAGAYLAQTYPNATVVTTCKRLDGVLPTLATIYADELIALGVPRERIVTEELSVNTGTSVTQVIALATERGWQDLFFVSSGFQIPRIKAFFEAAKSDLSVTFVTSESVITEHDPAFAPYFAEVEARPEYATRLAAEARGIEAIKNGTYQVARIEDKKER